MLFRKKPKRVFVAGYFDGLHSGHIRFLEAAAAYGEVHVGIGCDDRLRKVKQREPIFPENERLYMINACRHVHRAFVMPEVDGDGGVVWERYLAEIRPDYMLANDDVPPEWAEIQRAACRKHGVEYVTLARTPPAGMAGRSSTEISVDPKCFLTA